MNIRCFLQIKFSGIPVDKRLSRAFVLKHADKLFNYSPEYLKYWSKLFKHLIEPLSLKKIQNAPPSIYIITRLMLSQSLTVVIRYSQAILGKFWHLIKYLCIIYMEKHHPLFKWFINIVYQLFLQIPRKFF